MKKVLIFITWVSVLGCNSYIFEDYFPLKEGNQWIYTDGESEFQSYVEKSDSLYHMVLGNRSYYFLKDFSGIYHKRSIVKTYNGDKVEFGDIMELYLPNPIIDNDIFTYNKIFKKVFGGDTATFYYSNSIKIELIGDLEIMRKKFHSCYLVERILILDYDTIQTKEYYAPDIGLVRIEENGKIWDLKECSLY